MTYEKKKNMITLGDYYYHITWGEKAMPSSSSYNDMDKERSLMAKKLL